MAIIDFNPEDAMNAVTVDPGVYPAVVLSIDGPKASTSQKSVSFFAKFQITAGKYQSKVLEVAFNTGTQQPSMMGTMQFNPHSGLLQVEAAIKNKKVEAIKQKLDTDQIVGKPLCIQVGAVPDSTGGRLLNMVLNFLPVGAEAAHAAGPGF